MQRILISLLLICWSGLLAANELSQAQQEAAQVKKDIAELQKLIKSTESEKSAALKSLKETEQEIGKLQQKINELESQLKDNSKQIELLHQQERELQSLQQQQQKLIAIQTRAAYQAGQKEPLRLLLNQQNPAQASHNLTYYKFMHQARQQQLDEYNQTIYQLDKLHQDITQQQQQLEANQRELKQQNSQLASLHKQRQQKVTLLNQQQNTQKQKLHSKQQDQKAIEQLLVTIETELKRQAKEAERRRLEQAKLLSQHSQQGQNNNGLQVSSQFTHPGGNFDKAKGKLPWPVNGRLAASFGSARGDTRSKWDGVLISSNPGTEVKVIHPGRVVFSDWLRGSGLLVIVDHGNGYLSLYGHNQSLISSAGDTVRAGQVIATVGNTGGVADNALYFAIRKNGKATDPSQWCRT